jgi:hypothetical protein
MERAGRLTRHNEGMTSISETSPAQTWISEMTTRIAGATGIDAAALAIDADTAETLLRLAAVAAHESGERTNAPLLCHVLGRAVALGTPLDDLARVVEGAV